MPTVSIITPCYNASKYVAELVNSVKSQTYTDWEHIIVDDGSTDDTVIIVKSLIAGDLRCRLVEKEHEGVSPARNFGYRFIDKNSKYIYFLDADDIIAPLFLSTMIFYLDNNPDVGLAFCDYECIDEKSNLIDKIVMPRYAPTLFWVKELANECADTPFISIYCWAPVMESLSVLRRSVYEKTPGWDEQLGQHGEGVDLFLYFALRSKVHFVPHALYLYRRHSSQSSASANKQVIQMKKIFDKWASLECINDDQRNYVLFAEKFRRYRVGSFLAYNQMKKEIKKKAFKSASRLLVVAIMRYFKYFMY